MGIAVQGGDPIAVSRSRRSGYAEKPSAGPAVGEDATHATAYAPGAAKLCVSLGAVETSCPSMRQTCFP